MHITPEPPTDDLPMAEIALAGGAFDFLADEPALYSEADVLPEASNV